jgi:FkbM family methyltransferase
MNRTLRQRLRSTLPFPVAAALRDARAQLRRVRPSRRLEHTLPSGVPVTIGNPSDWFVYNEVFVDGEYDDVIRQVVEGADATPLVLDLGANVGFFSLRFVDRWRAARGTTDLPRVVSVEGSPTTFRSLKRNLSRSPVSTYCFPHHGLAGKRSGTARISQSPNSGVNSIVSRASLLRSEAPFLDLTTLLPPDQRIALLKCDIEGAEQLLCENYPDLLQRVDLMVIELHHQFCDVPRCRALIAAAGLTRHAVILPLDSDDCTVERFAR